MRAVIVEYGLTPNIVITVITITSTWHTHTWPWFLLVTMIRSRNHFVEHAGKPLDAETRALDAVRGSLVRPVAAPPPASKPKNQGRKRKRGRNAKNADVEIAATKTAEELLDERERLAILNGDVVDVTESQ